MNTTKMSIESCIPAEKNRAWWFQPELIVIVVIVTGIYASRMTLLPVMNEECR